MVTSWACCRQRWHIFHEKEAKSALMRRTEELAQAILGVNILRSLFLDLLGRPRNSAAATAYRHRCDELAPNKYREYDKKWASFVLWGLALLSFMCCVTSFCALMSRDASALTLIFARGLPPVLYILVTISS